MRKTFKNITLHSFGHIALRLTAAAMVLSTLQPLTATAAQVTSRSLALGSSASNAVTTYNFTFTLPSATTVKSLDFTFCTAPSGTCTTPTGLVTTTAALGSTSNLGSGGTWTVGGTPTNGRIQIANASNTGSPSAAATANFTTITNPTLSGQQTPFYVIIKSYSDAAWTTGVDSGNVAAVITNQIAVTASVNESLDFCAVTGATCGAGGSTVALGTLSNAAATTGTSSLIAGTNAGSGYSIQYTGATLTGGANTIAATGVNGATSTVNTAQFGINVAANTVPSVGSAPSGGTGAGSTHYATANTFSFVPSTLTQIAAAAGSTADTTYTVSYLANIPANQAAGAYATTITYICTATF